MNIILYKDTLYNNQDLYNEVNSYEFLDGFVISATITNDGRIIVYNLAYNTSAFLKNLQNQNYDVLKANIFYEIEDFFETFKDYKGKIIINLVGVPVVIDKPNKNYEFVMRLKNILLQYDHLNLYICSAYDDIITYSVQELTNVKIGMVVYEGNLNYYDVDFYLIPSRLFDTKIIAQQLRLKKEIMLFLESSEEIVTITNKFKNELYLFSDLDSDIYQEYLNILTNTPVVINVFLNSEKN